MKRRHIPNFDLTCGVNDRIDLHHGWPFGRARLRAVLRARRASRGVLRHDGIAAGAVERGGVSFDRAVDGDLQASDARAEDQREEDEAAVGLAGAPLPIRLSNQRKIYFLSQRITSTKHRRSRINTEIILTKSKKTYKFLKKKKKTYYK